MTTTAATPQPSHYMMSMAIIGILFFIFGFVTWLNSSLILFVKVGFDVDLVPVPQSEFFAGKYQTVDDHDISVLHGASHPAAVTVSATRRSTPSPDASRP